MLTYSSWYLAARLGLELAEVHRYVRRYKDLIGSFEIVSIKDMIGGEDYGSPVVGVESSFGDAGMPVRRMRWVYKKDEHGKRIKVRVPGSIVSHPLKASTAEQRLVDSYDGLGNSGRPAMMYRLDTGQVLLLLMCLEGRKKPGLIDRRNELALEMIGELKLCESLTDKAMDVQLSVDEMQKSIGMMHDVVAAYHDYLEVDKIAADRLKLLGV